MKEPDLFEEIMEAIGKGSPPRVWWLRARVKCRICNAEHDAIQECDKDTDPFQDLECANCGNMACDLIEDDDA